MADSSNTRLDDSPAKFAERLADYMAERIIPWADEATMRGAVAEVVRLIFTDALDDTRRLVTDVQPPRRFDEMSTRANAVMCLLRAQYPNVYRAIQAEPDVAQVVDVALAAADAVERPAVERLVAALRGLVDEGYDALAECKYLHLTLYEELSTARNLLAEFGQQPTGDG